MLKSEIYQFKKLISGNFTHFLKVEFLWHSLVKSPNCSCLITERTLYTRKFQVKQRLIAIANRVNLIDLSERTRRRSFASAHAGDSEETARASRQWQRTRRKKRPTPARSGGGVAPPTPPRSVTIRRLWLWLLSPPKLTLSITSAFKWRKNTAFLALCSAFSLQAADGVMRRTLV